MVIGPPVKRLVNGRIQNFYPCHDDIERSTRKLADAWGFAYANNAWTKAKEQLLELEKTGKIRPARKVIVPEDTQPKAMPTVPQALRVIEAMIIDAKMTMISLYNLSKKRKLKPSEKIAFSESQLWLCNTNGGLEDLLSMVRLIHVGEALRKLKQFV